MASNKIIKETWQGNGASGRVASTFNSLATALNHIRGENGITVSVRKDCIRIIGHVQSIIKTPFSLGEMTSDTVTVNSNRGRTESAWFRGLRKTVGAGTGMTWESATDRWQSVALNADTWIWLKFSRADVTATIIAGTTLPDGDDETEIFPLWYIPVTETDGVYSIDKSNIVDLRNSHHVPGMG